MLPSDRSCRDGATVPASTNNAPSSAHHASQRYSAPSSSVFVVSKARLAEPAQIPVPSERRLKIEGHGLAAVSIRERADGAEGEHAIAAGQRDVVLQVHVDPVEIELAEVVVVELRRGHFVSAAAVRIRGVVTPVEGGGCLDLDEVCRCSETRGGVRAEDFLGGCESAIGSAPDTRTQIGGAASEIQLVRSPVHGATGFNDINEVVGAVGLEAVHPDAEVVFLGELVVLAERIDVDRSASQVERVDAGAHARVPSCAVCATGDESDLVWRSRIGISLRQRSIESDAELHAGPGGEITSPETDSLPSTKYFVEHVLVVVPIQSALDCRTLGGD